MKALVAIVTALALAGPGLAQDTAVNGQGAVLRALDKVNGQTMDQQIQSGGRARMFGLVVEMAECRYPAENPTGDAFAYLEIRNEGSTDVAFEGWMIASSPALNAMDHARYDVWVLRCITS